MFTLRWLLTGSNPGEDRWGGDAAEDGILRSDGTNSKVTYRAMLNVTLGEKPLGPLGGSPRQ